MDWPCSVQDFCQDREWLRHEGLRHEGLRHEGVKARRVKARRVKARRVKARRVKARRVKARRVKARRVKNEWLCQAANGNLHEHNDMWRQTDPKYQCVECVSSS